MSHPMHHGTVVVTGASGFLGSRLCATLRAAGWTVVGAARSAERIPAGVIARPTDLRRRVDELQTLVGGASAVVHCAGAAHRRDPSWSDVDYHALNGHAAGRLAAAARSAGVPRFILISSSSVYGRATAECRESQACKPAGVYGRSKLLGERLAARVLAGSETRLAILRSATICGPGDPGNLQRLVDAIRSRRFLWVGDGGNRKSLVARSCVCRVVERVLNDAELPPTLTMNLASCSPTVHEIVSTIGRLCSAPASPLRVPAQPITAAFRALSSLSGGRGPAGRGLAALQTWLAEDTIDNRRVTDRYGIAWPSLDAVLREQLGLPACPKEAAA
ncbi:MAG: NAD-dependent epimerase/dehydratase family protein [Planctomycetota bacterium]